MTLAVDVGERIGEEHYAFGFRTMVQAIGMSELMYGYLQGSAREHVAYCDQAQRSGIEARL